MILIAVRKNIDYDLFDFYDDYDVVYKKYKNYSLDDD
jgi:hypothetical protein